MRKQINNSIKSCLICQKVKPSNQNTRTYLHPIVPSKPLQLLCTDVTGPLPTARGGAKYVVAFFDVFSKYVKLYAIKTANAKTIIRRFSTHYLPSIGKPEAILSDNASNYTGKLWRRFLQDNGIKQILTSCFNPQGNPCERVFREFNRFIRTYAHEQHSQWINYIELFEQIVNNLPIYNTPYTPHELIHHAKEKNEWIDPLPKFPREESTTNEKIRQVLISLTRQAQLRTHAYNKKFGKVQKYQVGEYVLLKQHPKSSLIHKRNIKWQLKFKGPYIIYRIPHDGSYLLAFPKTGKIKGLYPHHDLKKFVRPKK